MMTDRRMRLSERCQRTRRGRALRSSLALGLALSICIGHSPAQKPVSPVATVEAQIRAQQYGVAVESTRQQLKLRPNDFHMWTLQAIALSLENQTAAAITAYEKALRLAPDYTPALKGEIELLYATGDKRAIPLLQRVLKAAPNDATAHEMLGTLYRKEGDCTKALSQFEVLPESDDVHGTTLAAKGYCLVQMRRYQDAVPIFEKLAAALPDQDNAQYDLALVLLSTKQYQAALDKLTPLIEKSTPDPDALSLASEANEALGHTPQAVALLHRAIVLSPTTPEYYVAFATLCLDHDSFKAGVDMLTVGLKYIPKNPSLHLSRGLLHAQLAEYDAAEEDFRLAEQLDSAQVLSAYALDLSELQRNNPEQALRQVQSQIKAHPQNPLLNYLLAKLLMNQAPAADTAEFKLAMDSVQRAIKLKPELVDAHDLLANIYMTEGHYDLAIQQCRIALQYAPNDETATYHLLTSLRHTGQKDELPALVKRLSQLHQDSLKKETDRKKFRLELASGP